MNGIFPIRPVAAGGGTKKEKKRKKKRSMVLRFTRERLRLLLLS